MLKIQSKVDYVDICIPYTNDTMTLRALHQSLLTLQTVADFFSVGGAEEAIPRFAAIEGFSDAAATTDLVNIAARHQSQGRPPPRGESRARLEGMGFTTLC